MQFVPWQYLADWKCVACGKCCKLYSVVLNFQEWLRIIGNYGAEKTTTGISKLFLKREEDGSCAFLQAFSGAYTCGLQHTKPNACRLWPFKILNKPKHGQAQQASYEYGGMTVYIYADSACTGLRYGTPAWDFAIYTLKEFVEIAIGQRSNQVRTTANFGFPKPYAQFRV